MLFRKKTEEAVPHNLSPKSLHSSVRAVSDNLLLHFLLPDSHMAPIVLICALPPHPKIHYQFPRVSCAPLVYSPCLSFSQFISPLSFLSYKIRTRNVLSHSTLARPNYSLFFVRVLVRQTIRSRSIQILSCAPIRSSIRPFSPSPAYTSPYPHSINRRT